MSSNLRLPDPVDLRATVVNLCKADPKRTSACNYVVDDKPECVVGQALHELGVSVPELRDLIGSINEVYALPHFDSPQDELDAVEFVERVQFYQDTGYSWGEALKRATGQLVRA